LRLADGGGAFACLLPDGTWTLLPEWMTSRERCARLELVREPQVAAAALAELVALFHALSAPISVAKIAETTPHTKEARYELLAPLLRITTELDPHLLIAYRFGAIFLTEKPPQGAGQPQAALELIRRGIVNNPAYWRLWQDLGFIYYWNLKDYRRAAQAFLIGSRQPGALFFMKAMAAKILAQGGDPRTSYDIWMELYEHAENDQLRSNAEMHLTAIRAAMAMKQLDEILARFEHATGHKARSFDDLVAAGWLRGIPVDSTGVPYQIGADGKTALGPRSKVPMHLLE